MSKSNAKPCDDDTAKISERDAEKTLLEQKMLGLQMKSGVGIVEIVRRELGDAYVMFERPHDRIQHTIFEAVDARQSITPDCTRRKMAGEPGMIELGQAYIDDCALVAPTYISETDAQRIMLGMTEQWRNYGVAGSRLRPLNLHEFLSLKIPPRELVLSPWLPEKGLVMIYAPRGVGKTLLGLSCGFAIASGGEFLGLRARRPRKVLYLDGEMPARLMQERLAQITQGFNSVPPDPSYFQMLSADREEFGLPDLGSQDGQAEIDASVGDAEVIIVDNISALVRTGRENEAEGWAVVQLWALAHRRAGRCVVFIHHAGKGGTQRGSSKREDVLDTVVALKRPANYKTDQGARFEVHIEKGRSIYGSDAEAFEALYEVREDVAIWTRAPIDDSELDSVVGALREGKSIRKIAADLGIDKSKVERVKKRAAERGMLYA